MPSKNLGVIIEWDETQVKRFTADPDGPLGVELMHRLAQVVLEGAKRRALVRSGRMRDAMTYIVDRDEHGLFAAVISPVQNPKSGMPYAFAHEGRKTRDRRPHRSLKPALRDIRKILTSD